MIYSCSGFSLTTSEISCIGSSCGSSCSARCRAARSSCSQTDFCLRARCIARPVPAGIKRPTMTFSFRPRSPSCLAHDRRFGQNTGRFLEGSGRDERIGRQGCLGNAQQNVFVSCRSLAFGDHADRFRPAVRNVRPVHR